jgi:hypothetical protein
MKHSVAVYAEAFIKKFGTELGTEITHIAFDDWLVEMGEFPADLVGGFKAVIRNKVRSRIKLHLRQLKSPRWLVVPKNKNACTIITTPPTTKELVEAARARNKNFTFLRDLRNMKARGKDSSIAAIWAVQHVTDIVEFIQDQQRRIDTLTEFCEQVVAQQAKQVEQNNQSLAQLKKPHNKTSSVTPLRVVDNKKSEQSK